jgi:hypothetical protein
MFVVSPGCNVTLATYSFALHSSIENASLKRLGLCKHDGVANKAVLLPDIFRLRSNSKGKGVHKKYKKPSKIKTALSGCNRFQYSPRID